MTTFLLPIHDEDGVYLSGAFAKDIEDAKYKFQVEILDNYDFDSKEEFAKSDWEDFAQLCEINHIQLGDIYDVNEFLPND